jgi:heme/copper-type cytochrome/quinol oxidase subunit 3
MLRHKKLNNVITTDTYFMIVHSNKGNHCAHVCFGTTFIIIHVLGMKTESEFSEVYLDNMIFHPQYDLIIQNLK